MAILCKVGLHQWRKCSLRCSDDCSCKCERCKVTRHEWDGCFCKKAGCKETRVDPTDEEGLARVAENPELGHYAREGAIVALSQLGTRAVDCLIRVLADADFRTCHAAADGLAKIGDLRAVGPLIATLSKRVHETPEEQNKIRWKLVEAITKMGVPAIDPLIEAINESSDEAFRLEAGKIVCALRGSIHDWAGCKCTKCGKTRDEGHQWAGCKCVTCGKTRDESHDWAGCKCQKCGKTRDDGHQWAGKTCSQCGKTHPDVEAAFKRLESQLHDGMTYEAAVRILGNPTRTIGGGALMGAFGRVSGPGAGAVAGMSFLEWQRPEGTFRANLRGGVLDDVKGWIE